jgi:hypothetical protein
MAARGFSFGDPGSRRLGGFILAVCALYGIVYLAVWIWRGEQPRFGDFFVLWSFGRFAIEQPPGGIYDPQLLQAFQGRLDPRFHSFNPFAYPPSFLLLLVPLAILPYVPAYLIWIGGGFVLYGLATLGRDWRSWSGLALLAAPTTVLAVISGQSGFLAAALATAGLRNARDRPILGGILLGLLSYKPQLGLLIPVALVAAGLWRTILTAGVTVLSLAAISTLLFGGSIWPEWFGTMALNWDLFEANRPSLGHLMPTVTANLLSLGIARDIVQPVQILVSVIVAATVWLCFRRDAGDEAVAVLLVGTILATPYAFIYDMPMVAGAACLALRARAARGQPLGLAEGAVLLLALGYPLAMLPRAGVLPLEAGFLALLFGLFARQALKQTA